MRLWIRSDLHIERLGEFHLLNADAPAHDVQILAGDTCYGLRRTIEAIDAVADRHVVLVAGNHEFHHRTLSIELDQGRDAAAKSTYVRFLERSSWTVAGIRFLGATLWSDFRLYGRPVEAMGHAAAHSADYDLVMAREQNPLSLDYRSHVLRPADTARYHAKTIAWLEQEFAKPFDGRRVVITHHAPAPGSITPEYASDPLTPAYVSDLTCRIERWQPALWIHGHTHSRFDYRIGNTRVICNPCGLWGGADAEETGYDPRLVVDV